MLFLSSITPPIISHAPLHPFLCRLDALILIFACVETSLEGVQDMTCYNPANEKWSKSKKSYLQNWLGISVKFNKKSIAGRESDLPEIVNLSDKSKMSLLCFLA